MVYPVFSQDTYTLSIEDSKNKIDSINLNIVEIIDGRKYNKDIGWVQTGALNKKRIANFNKPLADEIQSLFDKAVTTPTKLPVAIRINHLYISEYSKAMSEIGRAEISLDFFVKEPEEQYYFAGTFYNVIQHTSIEVTNHHPENIVSVIKKSLDQFVQRDWMNQINRKQSYTFDYIASGGEVKPDLSQIAIFNCQEYKNGIFTTFNEFVENNPSIVAGYDIKIGKKTTLQLLKDGKKEKVKEGVYGFAHEGVLYILFYKNYYPLQKSGDTFHFTGPYFVDSGSVATGAFFFGAVGGAIAASTSGERKTYKIDLSGGFVVEDR